MADNNALKICKGPYSTFKDMDKDPNTIYFVYEEENGKMKPESGRIYIGDIEFSLAAQCVTNLSFVTNGNATIEAINKTDN